MSSLWNRLKNGGMVLGTAMTAVIIATALLFAACDTPSTSGGGYNYIFNYTTIGDDLKAVIAAAKALKIPFADGETIDTVKTGFTVPLTGTSDTEVGWESNNTDLISIDGDKITVNKPRTGNDSEKVTLTATVSKNGQEIQRDFILTLPAPENIEPGAPINLVISGWSTDSVTLTWEAGGPGRYNGAAGTISGYTVYYRKINDFGSLKVLKTNHQYVDAGNKLTTAVLGLEAGTQYYIVVTAANEIGEGLVSTVADTHTNSEIAVRPDAPELIIRSAGDTEVGLAWAAPAFTGWKSGEPIPVKGYRVYQNDSGFDRVTNLTAVAETAPDVLTQTVTGLINGTAYYFAVTTVIDGTDNYEYESLPDGGLVSVTPNASINPIGGTAFALTVDDFEAQTNTAGQVIDVLITNEAGLVYGRDYSIAITGGGQIVQDTLMYNPDNKQIELTDKLDISHTGTYTITASGIGTYNDSVMDDFKLTVQWSTADLLDQAADSLDFSDFVFEDGESEDKVNTDFTVPESGYAGTTIEWESNDNGVITVDGGTTSVTPPDSGSKIVRLTATIKLGDQSVTKTFVLQVTTPGNKEPDVPTGITITDWTDKSIGLRWDAPSPGYVDGSKGTITGYTVYYSETDNFSNLEALKTANQVVEVQDNQAAVTGLDSGREYYFAITATNDYGTGELSDSSNTRTNSLPDAPVILERSASDRQIILSWVAPINTGWYKGQAAGIIEYTAYQSDLPITDATSLGTLIKTIVNPDTTDKASITVPNLPNDTAYYFAVIAKTSVGVSAPGGGDASVKPKTVITDLTDAGLTVSAADTTVLTNTAGQTITVTLADQGLTYGTAYTITVIKGGQATAALMYDSTAGSITVSDTLKTSDSGTYTILAIGETDYSGTVSDTFVMTVNLSDEDAVAADKAALDITAAAGGDLSSVGVDFIALPTLGANGSDIAWVSTNTAVIATDGTVNAPAMGAADEDVTLTATITKGAANATKVFELTVIPPVDVKNTLPGSPETLTVDSWGEGSVSLSWTAPDAGFEHGKAGRIAGYTVYYNTKNDFTDLSALAEAGQSVGVDGAILTATVNNLTPGTRYWFAVTASNANGAGSESQSIDTRINSNPESPIITGRTAGDEEVRLDWIAPVSTGWLNGVKAVVTRYEIYQASVKITDISGKTPVYTTSSASERTRTIIGLNNNTEVYFAMVTVTGTNNISALSGGDVPVTPSATVITLQSESVTVSVNNTSVFTNTEDQIIPVNLNDAGLVYGTDYTVNISMDGAGTSDLVYQPKDKTLAVSGTLNTTGAAAYTITASGLGEYTGTVDASFILTVLLSNAESVAAAKAALDISDAAGGKLDKVRDSFTLPNAGIEGTFISWQVISGSAIDVLGGTTASVTRPAAGNSDVAVTLQAKIIKGEVNDTKDFAITVLSDPAITANADTVPGEPTGVTFTAWAAESVSLSWTAPVNTRQGKRRYRNHNRLHRLL